MACRAPSTVVSLVAAVLLAGCGGSPSTPDRAGTQSVVAAEAEVSRSRTRELFQGVPATACGGETFIVTTVIDSWQHITRLASGEWQRSHHTTFSSNGVGTISGSRFIGRGIAHDTQVFAVLNDAAFTFAQVLRMRNIVQGSADNEILAVHVKWTQRPDGQIVVFLVDQEFECRG